MRVAALPQQIRIDELPSVRRSLSARVDTPRKPAKPKSFTLRDLNANAPRHCHHCHALGARDWWIWVWPENAACAVKTRVPYLCRSWRCPSCCTHEAHVCWTRMVEAFQPLDPTGCCLIILTLDRCGKFSGEQRWKNAQAAYRDLSKLSNDMMARLRKWMKKQGWEVLRNQWVATVEMHKSGWPHVNFVIWSPQLAAWLDEEKRQKLDDHMTEAESKFVSRELADIVTAAGWGLLSTAERAHSREQSLGYICKVAGKADESIGEISKLTQLPTAAPFRFRRLRAGKNFLPKRHKSETVTGTLVRRQNSNDGTRDVVPLHNVRTDLVKDSEEACYTEERIWLNELETAHRCARQVKLFGMSAVEVPPVTHWFKFRRLDRPPPRKANDDCVFDREQILYQFAV